MVDFDSIIVRLRINSWNSEQANGKVNFPTNKLSQNILWLKSQEQVEECFPKNRNSGWSTSDFFQFILFPINFLKVFIQGFYYPSKSKFLLLKDPMRAFSLPCFYQELIYPINSPPLVLLSQTVALFFSRNISLRGFSSKCFRLSFLRHS